MIVHLAPRMNVRAYPDHHDRKMSLRDNIAELHDEAFVWALTCCRGDRTEAQDVLQRAYIKAIEDDGERFEGRSSLKTWLFGIIRWTAHERRRKFARRFRLLSTWRPQDEVAPPRQPIEEVAVRARRERVLAALDDLSDKQRAVIELVFYHDLSIREASEVLDMSLGTARTHYARGKKALADSLRDLQGDLYDHTG
jgi:RNA polymerase sigma-70 factor (ECF subfamily)